MDLTSHIMWVVAELASETDEILRGSGVDGLSLVDAECSRVMQKQHYKIPLAR